MAGTDGVVLPAPPVEQVYRHFRHSRGNAVSLRTVHTEYSTDVFAKEDTKVATAFKDVCDNYATVQAVKQAKQSRVAAGMETADDTVRCL